MKNPDYRYSAVHWGRHILDIRREGVFRPQGRLQNRNLTSSYHVDLRFSVVGGHHFVPPSYCWFLERNHTHTFEKNVEKVLIEDRRKISYDFIFEKRPTPIKE